ncbi:uncharacterized protein [Ptychodera flava]|uniref:uncharacterized protein isoform X2 n=1 Tax=Ptychodera flava TaxID=63121 RepID=UPI003969FAEA
MATSTPAAHSTSANAPTTRGTTVVDSTTMTNTDATTTSLAQTVTITTNGDTSAGPDTTALASTSNNETPTSADNTRTTEQQSGPTASTSVTNTATVRTTSLHSTENTTDIQTTPSDNQTSTGDTTMNAGTTGSRVPGDPTARSDPVTTKITTPFETVRRGNSTASSTEGTRTDSSIICYVCDESNDQDCGTDLSSTGDYNETCQYNCWTILDSNGNTSRICNDTYESGSTSLSCDAASSQVCIDSSGVTECFYCCSSDYCNSETLSGSSRLPVASFITLLVAIVVSATNVSFH